jgi:hypothetical protein
MRRAFSARSDADTVGLTPDRHRSHVRRVAEPFRRGNLRRVAGVYCPSSSAQRVPDRGWPQDRLTACLVVSPRPPPSQVSGRTPAAFASGRSPGEPEHRPAAHRRSPSGERLTVALPLRSGWSISRCCVALCQRRLGQRSSVGSSLLRSMISLSKPLRAIRRRSLRAVNSPPAGGFRTQSGPGCRSRTGSPRVVPRRRRGHSRTWSAVEISFAVVPETVCPTY